jgi:holo-[acyl-carrier protein] synthase
MAALPRLRVGIDVCDVARMTRLVADHPALAERLFTAGELGGGRSRAQSGRHLAARFAAKEAVFKAFGTGIGAGMRWTEVEVVSESSGRPCVRLHGGAERWAAARGLVDLDLSLAHDAGIAVAEVVSLWARA